MNRLLSVAACAAASLIVSTHAYAADAPDPTAPGPFKAKVAEYKFPAKVDKLVTRFKRTELWGRIWYPNGKRTRSPLVILLHGNHATCGRKQGAFRIDDRTDYSTTGRCPAGYVVTPNHRGYDYVASRLASHGYLVVSINVNRGINALPDDARENDPGLIQRRGRMILRHLMLLSAWNSRGGQPRSIRYNLRNKIDFKRVTLFGHSRGGDGIVAAYNLYRTSAAWRKRAPGIRFIGLASMAPTDFQNGAPKIAGAPLSVLLPMCDGDVSRLSGIHFYDRSVRAPIPDTPGNFKSVLHVWGANHNGFNTQWQTDDNNPNNHTCPNQNRLFQPGPGLVPKQQTIGRYYLMALVRGVSESPKFARLLNPAFDLPNKLARVTRYDRSFFAGRGPRSLRLVRFDGTCSSKYQVTNNVFGQCSNIPEHNSPTPGAVARWDATATNPTAFFTLRNGQPVNLKPYATLDMRVGPDCHRVNSGGDFYCDAPTQFGNGTGGAQDVSIQLVDNGNRLSKPVNLAVFIDKREAVGISTVNLPSNPLYHALLSSARIPLARFRKAGFNFGAVTKIRINLGARQDTGGLFFGDIYAVSVPSVAVESGQEREEQESEPLEVATAERDSGSAAVLPVTAVKPATAAVGADAPAPDATAAASPADPGVRIISITHDSLPVATGESAPDDNPELAPVRSVPAVSFTIATPTQIIEGGAGLSLRIGNRLVRARRFETGRELDTPSVSRIVVPRAPIDRAPDGAGLALVGAGAIRQLGPLNKSGIR